MNAVRAPRPEELELAKEERLAIATLQRLGRRWPKTLLVFGGGGNALSVRRVPPDGSLYDDQWEVASIPGIRNDGGDGGRE